MHHQYKLLLLAVDIETSIMGKGCLKRQGSGMLIGRSGFEPRHHQVITVGCLGMTPTQSSHCMQRRPQARLENTKIVPISALTFTTT